MPWIAVMLSSIVVAVILLAGVFVGGRRNWPRKGILSLLGLSMVFFVAPAVAWSWSDPLVGPKRLTYEEQILSQSYNGRYGGLTIPHKFGRGKSNLNPPDILEAGGYIRELKLSPDGTQVESFALYTLQGNRLEFLVRPEIVPITDLWDVERFQIYSRCACLVALHFTRQPVGNVPIILFAVETTSIE